MKVYLSEFYRVHPVNSFPTSLHLQKSASIQAKTSLSKFGGDSIHLFIRLRTHNADHASAEGEVGRGVQPNFADKRGDASGRQLARKRSERALQAAVPVTHGAFGRGPHLAELLV